jgi:hypothetical protein
MVDFCNPVLASNTAALYIVVYGLNCPKVIPSLSFCSLAVFPLWGELRVFSPFDKPTVNSSLGLGFLNVDQIETGILRADAVDKRESPIASQDAA